MRIFHLTPDHPHALECLQWMAQVYGQAVEEEFSRSPARDFRRAGRHSGRDLFPVLQNLLQDEERSHFLVAETEKEKTGYFLGLVKECVGEDPSQIGYVNGLYVLPPFRRQGIAQQLWQCGLGWFRGKQLGVVELYLALENEEGRRFWRKNGYTPYEEVLFKRI